MGTAIRLTATDPIALALPSSSKRQKNRPKQPKPYNPHRAVTNSSMTPVTITGMTGHDAGIIGHDQRNTHLPTAPRLGAYGLTRFACQTAIEMEVQDKTEKPH